MTVVVCLKWVAHPGEPNDKRFAGMSPADQCALEFALQHAAAMGTDVAAVTVGPAGADHVLREAIACGAARAIRVDASRSLASADVASALVSALQSCEVVTRWVWCGDYSLDRGSGSVPAFLAARTGAAQALGIINVAPDGHATLACTRRLDGGRRELLSVAPPAVVSVEGGTTVLRRAALPAVRAALGAMIDVVPCAAERPVEAVVHPYRPRARALAAPSGEASLDRLRELVDVSGNAATSSGRGEHVTLDPPAAAARIVAALREWGYLDPS